MDNSTFQGKWCFDSETGEEWLIDLKTGDKIVTRGELPGIPEHLQVPRNPGSAGVI